MAASIKVILHSKKYNDGTQAVMLQCTTSDRTGKKVERRTLCLVLATQFDKAKRRVKKNHPNASAFNDLISQAYYTAERRLCVAELYGHPIRPEQIVVANEVEIARPGMLLGHIETYSILNIDGLLVPQIRQRSIRAIGTSWPNFWVKTKIVNRKTSI